MEIIVQLIAEEIKVVEFHSPNPKFFRCGNTFNLEVVSLLNMLLKNRIYTNLLISCKPLTLFF